MSENFQEVFEIGELTKKWRESTAWAYGGRVQRIEWLSVFGQDVSGTTRWHGKRHSVIQAIVWECKTSGGISTFSLPHLKSRPTLDPNQKLTTCGTGKTQCLHPERRRYRRSKSGRHSICPAIQRPQCPQFLSHEPCVGGMGARPIPVAKRSAKLSGLQQQRSSGVRAIGAPRSVNAGSSFPIDDVNELPGKPNKVVL